MKCFNLIVGMIAIGFVVVVCDLPLWVSLLLGAATGTLARHLDDKAEKRRGR